MSGQLLDPSDPDTTVHPGAAIRLLEPMADHRVDPPVRLQGNAGFAKSGAGAFHR